MYAFLSNTDDDTDIQLKTNTVDILGFDFFLWSRLSYLSYVKSDTIQ